MADDNTSVLWDVMIIGSGPAGWTAAIYAARASLKTLLFTGLEKGGLPGGQLMLTTEVENYPGFRDGIMGPELMDQMREQALRFGTELVEDDVTAVDFSKRPFTLNVGDEAYKGRAVIIATGASAIWLASTPRSGSRVAASRRAPPVTASSSATRRSSSSAAATRRWRRRPS